MVNAFDIDGLNSVIDTMVSASDYLSHNHQRRNFWSHNRNHNPYVQTLNAVNSFMIRPIVGPLLPIALRYLFYHQS